MNRDEYNLHRSGYRNALGVIRRARQYNAMADSTNNVQRIGEEESMRSLRALAQIHADKLPHGTDPLGFRSMYKRWAERRQRVEYATRMRRHDAEQRERFPAYFAASGK